MRCIAAGRYTACFYYELYIYINMFIPIEITDIISRCIVYLAGSCGYVHKYIDGAFRTVHMSRKLSVVAYPAARAIARGGGDAGY